jgi:hypothetical protein
MAQAKRERRAVSSLACRQANGLAAGALPPQVFPGKKPGSGCPWYSLGADRVQDHFAVRTLQGLDWPSSRVSRPGDLLGQGAVAVGEDDRAWRRGSLLRGT